MISVIVPVYRVESYLDLCVESLVRQTFRDLEIILVDDGSPDACGALCDAWAERDTRIRVLHKENGGLSDARNAGLAAASGAYIGFVDSDDWVADTMYEKLLAALETTGSDIAACGVRMVWEDGKTQLLTPEGSTVLENRAAMEAIVRESWLKQPVWYKLYRREVAQIPFALGKCHEDVFWSYQAIARAARVCVFDEPLYFYRQRGGSIMGEGFSPRRLDALEAKEQRLHFLEAQYPELTDLARRDLHCFARYLLQWSLRSENPDPVVRARLCAWAKEYPLKPESPRDRLWAILSRVSFPGVCRLRNFLGIGM